MVKRLAMFDRRADVESVKWVCLQRPVGMAYRYCPQCDHWYATHEYDVSEGGETICPKDDHAAVHGYIGREQSAAEWRRRTTLRNVDDEVEAAIDQGLLYE
jgi:hypothetical protein